MKLARGPRDAARYAAYPKAGRADAFLVLDLCGAALARRPDHFDALRAAADRLTALGYYQAGLALDRRLAKLRPDDPTVWYNYACSLSLTGEEPLTPALLALRRAVELGYGDVAHLRADADLARLREHPGFGSVLALAERRRG